jgi:hypothetical protein
MLKLYVVLMFVHFLVPYLPLKHTQAAPYSWYVQTSIILLTYLYDVTFDTCSLLL